MARNVKLARLVLRALEAARENGFDFAGLSPKEIASDMIDFDAEIAEFTCGPNGFDAAAFEEIVAILEAARA